MFAMDYCFFMQLEPINVDTTRGCLVKVSGKISYINDK